VVENNRVLPYGELWQVTATSQNEQKFTSYLRGNPEQGDYELDYAMARYYTNRYGRFVSRDPYSAGASLYSPQSWNAYSYGLSDPINYIDPNGGVPIPVVTGLIGAAVGGVFAAVTSAATQFVASGFDVYKITPSGVAHAFLGGAVTGGFAGATFGAAGAAGVSLTWGRAAGINAVAGAAGGLVERFSSGTTGTSWRDEALDIVLDGSVATIGGYRGSQIADEFIPLPNVRREIEMHNNTLFSITRKEASQADAARRYGLNGAIDGMIGEAVTTPGSAFYDYFRWLDFFQNQDRECVTVNIPGVETHPETCR
jgi:RHS repeat-associated protein